MCEQEITTIERTGDDREAFELRIEFDRNAVTLTQIAIEFIHRTRSPFLKASAVAARLQKRHRPDEYAGLVARHSVSALILKGEMPSNW
jgi:hypothetical protein